MSKILIKEIDMKTKTDWKLHLQQWENSGLTKVDYCRANKLNLQTFYTTSGKKQNQRIVELPFLFPAGEKIEQTIFEIKLTIPFSFKLKIDLNFGKRQ